MPQEILDYIQTQRVGVLAIEMLDGSPHGATIHFAHTDKPLQFFFETSQTYRKSEALLGRQTSRASFVIGCDESNMQTLQLDGEVRLITKEQTDTFDKVYFGKFPQKKDKKYEAPQLYFCFTPTWWRFTDWINPKGKTIITSDDK